MSVPNDMARLLDLGDPVPWKMPIASGVEGVHPSVAARPAEPTDELREALARWLRSRYPVTPDEAQQDADALLSGPLAPLLAKLRAVEALAEEMDAEGHRFARSLEAVGFRDASLAAATRLRRALAGES